MASRALRRGSSHTTTEERSIRVEDYLNDQLQTHADLSNLDSLLDSVKHQQILLREQLVEAESTLDVASKATKAHSATLLQHVQTFNKKQVDIDRRLLIVTHSDTSDDAVRKFDKNMEKLRRLDITKNYVELLAEVDSLSTETRQNFRAAPQAALGPYLRLQKLAIALKKAQPAAEDAAPHLVDHVEGTAKALWQQMKDAFAEDFEKTLTKMKWPEKDLSLDGTLEQEWAEGVQRLLELQEPELNAQDSQDKKDAPQNESIVLLPLEVMTRPLEMRFRYHFYGERSTNRLDKPEYFLSDIVRLLNTYEEFFAVYLQPVLYRHFKGSNLALNSSYIDSTTALITALLPMVRHKVFALLPQIAKEPQLLSHLMHELMSFDTSLKDDWSYDGGCGASGWKGITWEVLVQKDWFGKWLQVEKDFALSRYQAIIEPPESREIDYDSVEPGTTKPTKAAIRVNDLLETVTDRYRPLTSFSQKLRFLIDIQIAIFDRFHERLQSSLEAYLTMTSSIARTVQGVSKEEQAQLQGLGGIERLCRIYGSAEYLEKKMRDWSDDVFFLELWDELQFRARSKTRTGKNLAGDMSIENIAERTSSVVGSEEESGALFDETAGAYRQLRIRTETIMQDLLSSSIKETFRPYGRLNHWSSLDSDTTALAISPELDATVQLLSTYLLFLSKVLAEAPLRRIARHLTSTMQSFLWDTVLMRNTFSTTGVVQFQYDISALCEVISGILGTGQGELGMRKLREALGLLGMPVTMGEEENAARAAGEVGEADGVSAIWEVEKRVFRSNESAREVLEELGLEALNESDARNVLERRVEWVDR